MLKTWIVYDGGRQEHPETVRVLWEAQKWEKSVRKYPNHPSQHVIISDAVAQTIATWWQSPGQPYSTLLSTMGKVDRYTTLDAFGTPEQAETEDDAMALRALGAYIESKINSATSAAQPCACGDCFEIAVGIVGELCSECKEWGCDPTEQCQRCEVPSRYCDGCGASGDCDCFADPDTDCTEDCDGCLYCTPGA